MIQYVHIYIYMCLSLSLSIYIYIYMPGRAREQLLQPEEHLLLQGLRQMNIKQINKQITHQQQFKQRKHT